MTRSFSLSSLLARRASGVLATLTLAIVAAAAGVALLGVSGWFLTGAALTTAALSFNLFGPSALVRGLSFLRIGARYGEKLVGHDVTLRLLADIREDVFRRLTPRVPLHGARLRLGDLVSRLVADVDALDAIFLALIGPALAVAAGGVGVGAMLLWLVPPAAPVFGLGFAMAALVVPGSLVRVTRRSGERLVAGKARLRMAVLDGVEGHADLLAFGRTAAAHRQAEAANLAVSAESRRQSRANATASGAVVLLGGFTMLGVFLTGLGAVRAGALGGPTLVGLVLAVLASFEAAGLVVRGAGKGGAALAASGRLRALASAPPLVVEIGRPAILPPGHDIAFDRVWFSHRAERPLLQGLSLECPAGSRTAIVGDSGCGKSTVLELVARLADPDEGVVRVAGQDIATVALADLHARVTWMGQSSPVFLGTIRDNLQLAKGDAGDAELWDVLARARLDAFVRDLPQGLDTWCGEGGRTLSGGQARRLCLARSLLAPGAILLLDEPTAGLDRAAEHAFLADLPAATAGRTVLLATHAVLPPGMVDRVVRLADGVLTEEVA